MQAMPAEERSKILIGIADALEANEKIIIHENEADVATAQDDGYESSLVSRLALKPGKACHILNCGFHYVELYFLFLLNFVLYMTSFSNISFSYVIGL